MNDDSPVRERRGSLGALKNRDFALFWTAGSISNAGGWMQTVAVPALLFDLTRSSTWLGYASMASLIPAVLLTPYAGVLADRTSRRRILLITQTVMMVNAFALWASYLSGDINKWVILVSSLVGGVCTGYQTAAWQSFVPTLVPEEQLLDAVKLNSMQYTLARAIGPALAGLVVGTLGVGAAIFVNGSTFLLVLAALAVARPRQKLIDLSGEPVLRVLRQGARFVWRKKPIRIAVILGFVSSMCGQSLQHVAPAVAKRMFDKASTDNAGLLVALGIGSVLSSLVSVIIGDRLPRSRRVVFAFSLYIISTVVIVATSSYTIGLVGYFISGVAHLQAAMALNTMVQGTVPDHLRGRVTSFYLLGILGGIPVGTFVLGRLGDVFSMRTALVVDLGVLFMVLALIVVRGWLPLLDSTNIDDD